MAKHLPGIPRDRIERERGEVMTNNVNGQRDSAWRQRDSAWKQRDSAWR
jgi:hypothetical protein